MPYWQWESLEQVGYANISHYKGRKVNHWKKGMFQLQYSVILWTKIINVLFNQTDFAMHYY